MSDIIEASVFGHPFFCEHASLKFINTVLNDEYQVWCLKGLNLEAVVDVGAHVGSFTCLAHYLWPKAKIIAVEPSPYSFELLKKNTKHIPQDQLRLINAAIGENNNPSRFCMMPEASRIADYTAEVWDGISARSAEIFLSVPTITPLDLIREVELLGVDKVDVLKSDCEGAEYVLFEGLSNLRFLHKVTWIRGEWHHRPANARLAAALHRTHVYNINSNEPWPVGPFIGHKKPVATVPEQVLDDVPLKAGSSRLIITLATPWHADRLAITENRMREYALKCKADFFAVTDDKYPEFPMANKWRIPQLAKNYSEVLYLDSDVLVRRDAPVIFEAEEVASCPDAGFFAFDELPFVGNDYKAMVDEWHAMIGMPFPSVSFNAGVLLFRSFGLDYYIPRGHFLMSWAADQWWLSHVAEIGAVNFGKLGRHWNAPADKVPGRNGQQNWFLHALTPDKVGYLNWADSTFP